MGYSIVLQDSMHCFTIIGKNIYQQFDCLATIARFLQPISLVAVRCHPCFGLVSIRGV